MQPRLWTTVRIGWIGTGVVLATALALILLVTPAWAAATVGEGADPALDQAPLDQVAEELAVETSEQLDLTEIDRFLSELNQEIQPYVPPLGWRDLLDGIRGQGDWSLEALLTGVLRALFDQLVQNLDLLGQLVILAVLIALLENLQASFDRPAVGSLAYAVIYLALISLALGSFYLSMQLARGVVTQLVDFMLALLPVLVTLLVSMGGLASAGIFHPTMVFAVHVVGMLVADVIIPLLFLAAVIDIVSRFTEGFQLTSLGKLLRDASIGALGLLMTIFLGVMAVQGAAGSVADGVSLRTAKFAAKAFIPIVGGMFADATELVVNSSLLLRNAVGLAGLLAIILVTVFPLLKLTTLVLVYRLAGAIVQPVAGKPLVGSLGVIGNTLALMGVSVAAVSLMFFLTLTVFIGAGNLTVMFR